MNVIVCVAVSVCVCVSDTVCVCLCVSLSLCVRPCLCMQAGGKNMTSSEVDDVVSTLVAVMALVDTPPAVPPGACDSLFLTWPVLVCVCVWCTCLACRAGYGELCASAGMLLCACVWVPQPCKTRL